MDGLKGFFFVLKITYLVKKKIEKQTKKWSKNKNYVVSIRPQFISVFPFCSNVSEHQKYFYIREQSIG